MRTESQKLMSHPNLRQVSLDSQRVPLGKGNELLTKQPLPMSNTHYSHSSVFRNLDCTLQTPRELKKIWTPPRTIGLISLAVAWELGFKIKYIQ